MAKMAKNGCRLELTGRLGRDPELRYTSKGTPVCSFSVAFLSGKANDPAKKTIWFDLQAWRELGEQIGSQFHKGDTIQVISASPNLNEWTDRNTGQRRTKTTWTAWEVAGVEELEDDQPEPQEATTANVNGTSYNAPAYNPDDDIPF